MNGWTKQKQCTHPPPLTFQNKRIDENFEDYDNDCKVTKVDGAYTAQIPVPNISPSTNFPSAKFPKLQPWPQLLWILSNLFIETEVTQ